MYCYSDDQTVDQSVESRANLARLTLVDGVYSRESTTLSNNEEFVIDIAFNNAITFNSLTLKKVLNAAGTDYDDMYNNTCLTLTTMDPDTGITTAGHCVNGYCPILGICTDRDYGFGSNTYSTESSDNQPDIVFAGALTGTENVVSARLTFDTTWTGSHAMIEGPFVEVAQMIIT